MDPSRQHLERTMVTTLVVLIVALLVVAGVIGYLVERQRVNRE